MINFEAVAKHQGNTQEQSFQAPRRTTGEEHKGMDATQKSAPLSLDENRHRYIERRAADPTPA
jgi:hypothetical protein